MARYRMLNPTDSLFRHPMNDRDTRIRLVSEFVTRNRPAEFVVSKYDFPRSKKLQDHGMFHRFLVLADRAVFIDDDLNEYPFKDRSGGATYSIDFINAQFGK